MKWTDTKPTFKGKTNAKLCRAIDAAIHAFVIENLADNGSGGLSMLEKYIKALVSATRTPQRQEPLQNMVKQTWITR